MDRIVWRSAPEQLFLFPGDAFMNSTPALVFAALLFVTTARASEPSPPPATTAAPAAPATPVATAPALSASECDVWNREVSFAASVEKHDAKAFAEHLHPGAVFLGGHNRAKRGSATIAESWAGIVNGEGGVLHWHPDLVVIGGDPNVALSRGPWWIADTSPDAKAPYVMGSYISTWVKDDKGVWHVLFDGGGGSEAAPASADDIAKLTASLPAVCPQK
jgi:ketosteroid isomerase-like protein